MSRYPHPIDASATAKEDATVLVFVVFELSKAKWKLGVVLPGSTKLSRYTVDGGDTAAVAARLAAVRAKASAGGSREVGIVSAYEAGYDGFWLHRWLAEQGVVNHVLDPASIQVDRRMRRAKTDRLDLEQLMRVLLAYWRGEPRVCSVARPPSVEQEDARRRHRERQRLIRERGAHVNRIKALLHGQGIRDVEPLRRNFLTRLNQLQTGDGHVLPPALRTEIEREHARLRLLVEQIAAVEAESRAIVQQAAPAAPAAKVAQLTQLKSIGEASAQLLVNEVFYRTFNNRREVGGYLGLTGTPYDSGQSRREQGISKAGNARARATAIELAWLWLRHQPDSDLTRWFMQRVRDLKGRIRKISIVALARKLMIALWRFLETGLVPGGAVLRAATRG
jgi:transposase